MSDKIYCGSAKIVPTQYGELTKVSFHKDDINKMVAYIKENGGDWINLVLKEKKEKVQGKPTHYLEVDTWKPTPQAEQQQQPAPPITDDLEDKLPF
jgi:hypothetical protein